MAGGIVLGVLALIGIGGFYYMQQSFKATEGITSIAEELRGQQGEPKVEKLSKDPTISGEYNMEEAQLQKYLHHMTHQKVEAEEKWGSVKMTPENIESLLAIAETNQDKYKYGEYYSMVLKEWRAGIFENSVDVHNFIWQQQGGTVGHATGLLEKAEEQAYIEERFSD